MSTPSEPSYSPDEDVQIAAAEWVLRCDRGLTPTEQDEYSQWLAADPRHRRAIAEQRWSWDELDRLAGAQASEDAIPDPDLLAPPTRRNRFRKLAFYVGFPVALAASTVVAFYYTRPQVRVDHAMTVQAASVPLTALCDRKTLDDGSVVDLNRGALLDVAFSPATRRVHLTRGEANFKVAKDPARPFVVDVQGVAVQAVGTVFNVRLDNDAIEVVVSEGTVKVNPQNRTDALQLVHAGQRAVVRLASSLSAQVDNLSEKEMSARLAWQPRLLDFTDAPLSEIVAAFNAHNPVRLMIVDPSIADVRLTATFRSDNVEGFVRSLPSADVAIRVERKGEGEIELSRAR